MPVLDVEEDLGRDACEFHPLAGEVRGVVGGSDGDEALEEVPTPVAPGRTDQVREVDLESLALADQALHFAGLGRIRGSTEATGRRAGRRCHAWCWRVFSTGCLDKQVARRTFGSEDLPRASRMVEHGVGPIVVGEEGRVGRLVARCDADQVEPGVVGDRAEPDPFAVGGVDEPRWNRRQPGTMRTNDRLVGVDSQQRPRAKARLLQAGQERGCVARGVEPAGGSKGGRHTRQGIRLCFATLLWGQTPKQSCSSSLAPVASLAWFVYLDGLACSRIGFELCFGV